jgi:hypothetical protein
MRKLTTVLAILFLSIGLQAQNFKNIYVKSAEPRPDSEIYQLVNDLKGNAFFTQRLAMLQKAVNGSSLGFTGAHTVQILSAFGTSTEKAKAIAIMDEHILGMRSSNVIEAINTAMFSSHKLAILEALRSTITDDDKRYSILDAFKTSIDKKKAKAILDRIEQPRSFIYGTIISKEVVFVVDVSGSMNAKFQLSNGQEVSRIDFVRNELKKAVAILPPDRKINVIMFSSSADAWKSRLISATKPNKLDAFKFANRYNVQGATNIHGALQAAFDDRNVKTIYFLTDGVPTAGQVQDPNQIINEVRQMNQGRNVRIHTCAFIMGQFMGDNKPQSKMIMRKLAEATNGVYRAFE